MGFSQFPISGHTETHREHAKHAEHEGWAEDMRQPGGKGRTEYREQIDFQSLCAAQKYSRDDRSRSNLKRVKVFTLPL